MKRWVLVAGIFLLTAAHGWAAQKYDVRGLVLKVDPSRKSMLVSCESIPGYMEAMTMPFTVRESSNAGGFAAGHGGRISLWWLTTIPRTPTMFALGRLRTWNSIPHRRAGCTFWRRWWRRASSLPGALAIGQPVPDFTLTDQNRRRVALSQFAGKVVAVTFIYTRCPFPNYCFRLSNNFGQLQKRFKEQMGRDLVLLSIVIDPANDGPEALTNYAQIWKADSDGWHFLTGPLPEIQQVAGKFDMNFYPDEALLVHSFHTAVIDRQSRLAANLEGNEFTAPATGRPGGDIARSAQLILQDSPNINVE